MLNLEWASVEFAATFENLFLDIQWKLLGRLFVIPRWCHNNRHASKKDGENHKQTAWKSSPPVFRQQITAICCYMFHDRPWNCFSWFLNLVVYIALKFCESFCHVTHFFRHFFLNFQVLALATCNLFLNPWKNYSSSHGWRHRLSNTHWRKTFADGIYFASEHLRWETVARAAAPYCDRNNLLKRELVKALFWKAIFILSNHIERKTLSS